MAIDLNAIAQMHTLKAQKKESSSKKLQTAIKEGFEKIDMSNKKVTATEASAVDNFLKTLSYASTDEELSMAHELNDTWLADANKREMYTRDKTLNQAIYDSKKQMINMVSDRQDDYNNLNQNISSLSSQLQELQTSDNEEYDFTEINEVLTNYRQAGENMIRYNQNWVGKQEYKNNIAEVQNWIKVGKIFQGMDQSPYSSETIDAVYETKTEVLSPEVQGIDMSSSMITEDFDANNAWGSVESLYLGGGMDQALFNLPENYELSEDQRALKTKAEQAIFDTMEYHSLIENKHGHNWADGEEEINGVPNGEYYGYTQILNEHYNSSKDAVNEFLGSLNQEHVPEKIREYEELVTDMQFIEKGEEGIQLHEDYKDQPYFQVLIDRAFDQWKLGDETGANSTMGLATKYMIEGLRNKDQAEAEITANKNKFLYDDYIPTLSEDRMDAIEDYAEKLQVDPSLMETRPEGMSDDEALIAERLAIGNEYFPEIHGAWLARSNELFNDKALRYEQNIYQKLEDMDNYFSADNVGGLAKEMDKVTTYTIGKETLTNPKVRGQVAEAIVDNVEDFFKELSDSDIEGMADMKAIMNGTYKDGSVEWYMAMDRVLENTYLKIQSQEEEKKEMLIGLLNISGGETWHGMGTDELEKGKMKGLMKLLEGYAAIRDFDSYMDEDPTDTLGLWSKQK